MFEFVFSYIRPDGCAPQVGDTSDGRAHILSNFGKWEKDDHRYLLGIGSNLFGRSDFFRASENDFQEAFWLCKRLMADKIKRLEKIRLDEAFDYGKLKSLSTEARQKLSRIQPRSIGQASRISGVSPSDISVLLIYMGR